MSIKGLSKYSPIKLRLSRETHEALITRQGQWIRWMIGEKCSCILDTGRPDLHCQYCKGDGFKYDFQKSADIYDQDAVVTSDWVCRVRTEDTINSVISLMDYRREEKYTIVSVEGNYITFLGERKPYKNEFLKASYTRLLYETLTVDCKYLGNNQFEADIYILTEYGEITGDILSVVKIENETKAEEYTVFSFYRNKIITEEPSIEPEPTDVIKAEITYLPPFKFLVVSQMARKTDQEWLAELGGDASLTFPSYCRVGEGDVITLLIGTQTQKRILTKSTAESDSTVPEEIYALLNELKVEYEAHRVFTTGGVHGAADNTNAVTAADADTKATAITLTNDLKTQFNAHCALVDSVHGAADETNPVTEEDLEEGATWTEISTMAGAIKTGYEAHRILTTDDVHGAADSTNVVDDIIGYYDRIPEFYVSEVQSIETLAAEYVKGTDYILFDRNRIKWIGNTPVAGENMYVLFDFYPTYRVLREFPGVRSAENQRLPKRVAIKLFSAGGNVNEGI